MSRSGTRSVSHAICMFSVGLCWALLSGSGAATEPPNAKGAEDLVRAVQSGELGHLKALLSQGTDPNQPDQTSMTPLHYAAYKGDVAAVTILLEGGARTTARDDLGLTPLHAAAYNGHEQVVEILLAYKACPEARDSSGNTALHLAAREGRLAAAKALLAAGADPRSKNARGASPIKLAQEARQDAMVLLLFDAPSPKPEAPEAHSSGQVAAAPKASLPVRSFTDENLPHAGFTTGFMNSSSGSGYSPLVQEILDARGAGAAQGGAADSSAAKDPWAALDRRRVIEQQIRDLKEKLAAAESRLPELTQKCDDWQRLKRGEQVGYEVLKDGPSGSSTTYSLPGGGSYSETSAPSEAQIRAYKEQIQRDEEESCGALRSCTAAIQSIPGQIDALEKELQGVEKPKVTSSPAYLTR